MPCSVLVVEDDPHVRVVLDQLLQDQGLEVWSVGDDLSAYQVLNQEAERIRLLLTDINLGAASDGFDVARRAPTATNSQKLHWSQSEVEAVDSGACQSVGKSRSQYVSVCDVAA